MRLPWVARSVAEFWRDAALRGDARSAELHQELERERDRYERLVERTVEMQRQGFVARTPETYTDTTPKFPDLVVAAILGRSPGLSSEVGRQLVAFASQELAAGRDAQAVADSIWNGGGE